MRSATIYRARDSSGPSTGLGTRFVRRSRAVETGGTASRGGEVSFRLKWMNGRVTLEEGEHLIGRDPDAEIFLSSAGVSRRHARIGISTGRATIEDLGSKNGTFVGDQRARARYYSAMGILSASAP